ncbi:phage protein [Stenotrophomonas maltophilia]|nr:phage protein [Stenotrophomonas maltophilia]
MAGTVLAVATAPTLAWSLIVRDRKLTGPWAGFSFKAGRLVTPEGRELEPQDLAWLSLTAAQAQEWRRMMESGRAIGKPRKALSFNAASVVNLSDALAQRRKKRSSVAMAGPDAEPPAAVLPVPGPKRRQRV